MTRKPRLSPSRLDGATVILHRFDERGGEGVNYLEIRLAEDEASADRGKSGEGR